MTLSLSEGKGITIVKNNKDEEITFQVTKITSKKVMIQLRYPDGTEITRLRID